MEGPGSTIYFTTNRLRTGSGAFFFNLELYSIPSHCLRRYFVCSRFSKSRIIKCFCILKTGVVVPCCNLEYDKFADYRFKLILSVNLDP